MNFISLFSIADYGFFFILKMSSRNKVNEVYLSIKSIPGYYDGNFGTNVGLNLFGL